MSNSTYNLSAFFLTHPHPSPVLWHSGQSQCQWSVLTPEVAAQSFHAQTHHRSASPLLLAAAKNSSTHYTETG